MKAFVFPLLSLFLCASLMAQDTQSPSPIIFICDGSGSMWGQIEGKTKMEIATTVLTQSIEKLAENQPVGLVAYGHRQKGDCKDVEFLVDTEKGSKAAVNQSLKGIKPLGKTPLAYSATLVIDKLRKSKTKATIILVTDGIESCDGDICAVVKAAKEEGIDFKLHIIGFGLKAIETEQLKCAAKTGDGQYFDAANADGLGEVLDVATSASVDKPKGNFSVLALKNGKAIDAYVQAFVAGTKTSAGMVRTYRDSALLYLEPGSYDLVVRALENSDVAPISIPIIQAKDGTQGHQTIRFDAGKLQVHTMNNGEGWDYMVKVIAKADGKVAASGRTYGKAKVFDVNPGVYDIELNPLVIEGVDKTRYIKDVIIQGDETNEQQFIQETGVAMIGVKSSTGLVDAIVKITELKTKKAAASRRTYTSVESNPKKFILITGEYEVEVRGLGDFKAKSETFKMTIKRGETFEKILRF